MIFSKYLSLALFALALCAIPASAAVTVYSPSNGSTVPQQFTLKATAASCSGQSVAGMGFSIDDSTNTTIIQNTSIDTMVSAPAGTHTLHVKAWGNAGASCVADLALNVSSTSAAANTVSVTTPSIGAAVNSPFAVIANVSTCSSQAIAAMGYSLDYGATTIVYSTNINASVIATAGSHTLHVKAWGNAGSVCVKDVPITVSSATQSATLTISSSSIAFGSVNLNTTVTQALTLTSTGTAAVTISGISITGTGFTYSGVSLPLTLNPNQTATLYVMFDPTTTGSIAGQLSISSNSSTGSQATVALSGSGQSASHTVDLNWLAPTSSSDPVVGYVVLRAPSGGSYQQINSSAVSQTTFTDSNVQSGQTYSYTVESVGQSGNMSAPSNVATTAIP